MSGSIVGGVDLLDSVESSDISELISGGDHEITDALPGGWVDVDTSGNVSLVALEVESGDLDTEEGWDDNSSLEETVKDSNVGVGNSLDFSLEGSSGHTREDTLERGGIDGANVGGREGTEDFSSRGGNLSNSL